MSTDVRDWLRDNGHDVRTRGKIPENLQAEYDAAHPPAPATAEIIESAYPDLDAGVTAADFPPDDAGPDAGTADSTSAAAPKSRARSERRPRKVTPAKPKRFTERIFGTREHKARPRQARVPLGDFAEETWADLAWLAQPVPPLAEMLAIQAPYAGVVFDQQVKGTIVDTWLQPVARHAGTFRALNGLVGPPVYVAMICAAGKRVQAMDPETGQPAVYPDGTPVMVNDGRTTMLMAGLRYSLLQMMKISDQNVEEITERAEQAIVRNRAVDALIERIFAVPGMAMAPQAPPAGASTPTPPAGGFQYPDTPSMDGVGADPGRM